MAQGHTIIMLNTGNTNFGGLPTVAAEFKTAWWLGSVNDNNMGTVVHKGAIPITAGMAPDGWADEGWYNLVQGGVNFILDGKMQDGAEVLIRSIDLMGAVGAASSLQDNPYKTLARNKALLWQTGIVASGSSAASPGDGGALIVAGLNLLQPLASNIQVGVSSHGRMHRKKRASIPQPQFPEKDWLLYQVMQYAFTGPKPAKFMEAKVSQCPDCTPA